LNEKLPGKGNGLFLEVVPKREVPQHLKKSMVPGRHSNVFEVIMLSRNSKTLLTRGRPFFFTTLGPEKGILKLIHPGIAKEQGRIVARNKTRAWKSLMPLLGKVG
jgi:hypothetical protein